MKLEHRCIEPQQLKYPTPILFVHGAWHGAWCWNQGFLEHFAERGFSAHALSLRGHVASEGRSGLRHARIADYVEDVETIAAQLPSKPIVVGHSMGGAIVQKYLETNAAPAGILLASLPPGGILPTLLRIHKSHPLIALKMHLTLSLYPIVATPELAQKLFFSASMNKQTLDHFHSFLQDESYLAFLDMLIFNLPKPGRVKAPMLVMGAENDTVFLPDQVAATAKAYGVAPVMFAKMAHDMMLEDNWESVADTIIEWLLTRQPPAQTNK